MLFIIYNKVLRKGTEPCAFIETKVKHSMSLLLPQKKHRSRGTHFNEALLYFRPFRSVLRLIKI